MNKRFPFAAAVLAAAVFVAHAQDTAQFVPTKVTELSDGRYVYRDLGSIATEAINIALSGKTTADEPIFSTRNDAASTYILNPTGWASSFDLTSESIWNSQTGGTPPNSYKTGTLVTPRNVIMAQHYYPPNNTTFRVRTATNTVETRTLLNSVQVPNTDIRVGILDSDVPPGTSFVKVLSPAQETALVGAPMLMIDQDQSAFVGDITAVRLNLGTNIGMVTAASQSSNAVRSPFYKSLVSGDSSHPGYVILDGTPVLIGVAYGPDVFASIAQNYDAVNTALATLGGPYRLTQYQSPVPVPSIGTAGTDINVAGFTINIPDASSTARGAVTSADWNIFKGKADTAANVGTGTGLFKQKANVGGAQQLQFRTPKAGSHIVITPNGDDLVFDAALTGGNAINLLDLGDAPHSYAGQANKVLAVSAGENGTQFANPSQSGIAVEFRSDLTSRTDLAAVPTTSLTGAKMSPWVAGKMIQFVDTADFDGPLLVTYVLIDYPDFYTSINDFGQPNEGVEPADFNPTTNTKLWALLTKADLIGGMGNGMGSLMLPESGLFLAPNLVTADTSTGVIQTAYRALGTQAESDGLGSTTLNNESRWIFTGSSASYVTLGEIQASQTNAGPVIGAEVLVMNAGTAPFDIRSNNAAIIATLQPGESANCVARAVANTWLIVRSARQGLTPSATSASAIDWSKSKTHTKTLSANTTFTMSNIADGDTVRVYLTNTASNYTASWTNPSGLTIKWPTGTPPTITAGAKTDEIVFTRVGTNIFGKATQNY